MIRERLMIPWENFKIDKKQELFFVMKNGGK